MKTPKQLKDSTKIAVYSFTSAAVLIIVYAIIGFILIFKNLKQ